MFSVNAELRALVISLEAKKIPYALCGALALAVHGYPRATLDIDLLALAESGEQVRGCARHCGFTLEAAPMAFANGAVRIQRFSKVIAEIEDVLMLDVLTLASSIEQVIMVETVEWEGILLRTVTRESLVRLKMLRGSAQDLADVEKLR